MMYFRILALLVPLLLLACETVPSDFVAVCPPVAAYSPAFEKQLQTEMASLPDSSALVVAMRDYLRLRDQVRECRLENNSDAVSRS